MQLRLPRQTDARPTSYMTMGARQVGARCLVLSSVMSCVASSSWVPLQCMAYLLGILLSCKLKTKIQKSVVYSKVRKK